MARARRPGLLIVEAGAIDRREASQQVARCGVQSMFTRTYAEAARLLARVEVRAVVIAPPLRDADTFSVAASLRRRWPDVPVAVVLGTSRIDNRAARMLWMSGTPVEAVISDAAAAVGALRGLSWLDAVWEELTADAPSPFAVF